MKYCILCGQLVPSRHPDYKQHLLDCHDGPLYPVAAYFADTPSSGANANCDFMDLDRVCSGFEEVQDCGDADVDMYPFGVDGQPWVCEGSGQPWVCEEDFEEDEIMCALGGFVDDGTQEGEDAVDDLHDDVEMEDGDIPLADDWSANSNSITRLPLKTMVLFLSRFFMRFRYSPLQQVQVLKLLRGLVPSSLLPCSRDAWNKTRRVATGVSQPQHVPFCPKCEKICPICLPSVVALPANGVTCEHRVCEDCGSARKTVKGINVVPGVKAFLQAYHAMLVKPGTS